MRDYLTLEDQRPASDRAPPGLPAIQPGVAVRRPARRKKTGVIAPESKTITGEAAPAVEIMAPGAPGWQKGKSTGAPGWQKGKSTFTPALGDVICDRLAEGRTLRQVCRDSDIPVDERTVRRWAMTPGHPFVEQYELARLVGFLSMAEEMLEIADDSTNDWCNREGRRGVQVRALDYEHVERSKVRIETRKWLLSKALPKLFGRFAPMRTEPAGEGSGGGFLPLLRFMSSELNQMVAAFKREESGKRPKHHQLFLWWKAVGSPGVKEAFGEDVARQLTHEQLLERYEAVRLAYADDVESEPSPQKSSRKAGTIGAPQPTPRALKIAAIEEDEDD
jgi:hypothetical protein